MAEKLKLYAVQFLSRDCVPDSLRGCNEWNPYFDKSIAIVGALTKRGLWTEPTFPLPWPQRAAVGAFEFRDPFSDYRWPAYLFGQGTVSFESEQEFTFETGRNFLHEFAEFMWNSFTTMKTLTGLEGIDDQRAELKGYRFGNYDLLGDRDSMPGPSIFATTVNVRGCPTNSAGILTTW